MDNCSTRCFFVSYEDTILQLFLFRFLSLFSKYLIPYQDTQNYKESKSQTYVHWERLRDKSDYFVMLQNSNASASVKTLLYIAQCLISQLIHLEVETQEFLAQIHQFQLFVAALTPVVVYILLQFLYTTIFHEPSIVITKKYQVFILYVVIVTLFQFIDETKL